MRVAAKESARLQAAQSSLPARSHTKTARGVTRPLPDVSEYARWDEEEGEATIQPTFSLPRVPTVGRQGLITSGKYAALPTRQKDAEQLLPDLVEDETSRATALLFIPGHAPRRKQEAASKKRYLLYYRLGMGLASLLLLIVAGVSLSGMRFGAMAFEMAASHEGNAAATAQSDYYSGMSGMDLSANSAMGQNGAQLPSSAPPPPLARMKPTPPPAPPAPPPGTPGGPYSSWTPPPGYQSFAVQDFPGDPWAGSFGQCTWWAHYKRSDENFAGMGDAWNWANAARARGYTVTSTPAANATIVFAPGVQGASSLGHVAHVEKVLTGGWVLISEMNFYWNGGGFARVDYRYAYASSGVWFIH